MASFEQCFSYVQQAVQYVQDRVRQETVTPAQEEEILLAAKQHRGRMDDACLEGDFEATKIAARAFMTTSKECLARIVLREKGGEADARDLGKPSENLIKGQQQSR